MSISCIGSLIGALENVLISDSFNMEIADEDYMNAPSAVSETNKKYGRPNQIGNLIDVDELNSFEPGMAQKIQECIDNKEKAKEAEDYDLAVALKDAAEFLIDRAREFK